MDFTSATKEQLYQIAIDDEVPTSIRYEVARELQGRRFDGDMLTDLVRMWPAYTAPEIAEHLGIPTSVVIGVANRYGLIGRQGA